MCILMILNTSSKKKKKIWSLFFFQKLKIDIKLKNAKKYIKYATYI